jgi:zona occludens toxin (predicted ATPase)
MIRAVTGMPGEGKTCFSVQHIIIEELIHGSKPIYTNIVFNLDELESYLEKRGYEADLSRIHFMQEDQLADFWNHIPNGCLAVLDEVAEYFNSQAWKAIGREAGTWARQHRKLGHEPYLVVQELSHIFKQFRDLVGEEIRVTNMNNHKILGIRLPKFFNAKWVWKDAKTVSRQKLYRFSTDIFAVYDTMATSGVLERGEIVEAQETKSKKKLRLRQKFFGFLGENWLWLMPISILGVLLFFAIYIPSQMMDQTTEKTENAKTYKENNGTLAGMPRNEQSSGDRSRKSSSGTSLNGRYDSISKRSP